MTNADGLGTKPVHAIASPTLLLGLFGPPLQNRDSLCVCSGSSIFGYCRQCLAAVHNLHSTLLVGHHARWRERTVCLASDGTTLFFHGCTHASRFVIPFSMCAGAHTECSSFRAGVLQTASVGAVLPSFRFCLPSLVARAMQGAQPSPSAIFKLD
jgi:hypothetical protein